jgi:hypothetical protein
MCFDQTYRLLIGGDFNLLRFSFEKNKTLRKNRHNDIFNQVINLYELRELMMTSGLFTWSNNHKNPTLEKLDRVLVSRTWELLLPLAMVHKIPRNNSDHNSLVIKLNNEHAKPIKNLIYELFWRNEEDFLKRV